MIWARWAGVMGVPMKWEIARIFVVGTGGCGFCAEAAPSGVIGFFMAVAPLDGDVAGCSRSGLISTRCASLPFLVSPLQLDRVFNQLCDIERVDQSHSEICASPSPTSCDILAIAFGVDADRGS